MDIKATITIKSKQLKFGLLSGGPTSGFKWRLRVLASGLNFIKRFKWHL